MSTNVEDARKRYRKYDRLFQEVFYELRFVLKLHIEVIDGSQSVRAVNYEEQMSVKSVR